MSSAPSIPPTIRAWLHSQRGPPSRVLRLSTMPSPSLTTPSSVMVRVTHAALNPGGSIMLHLVPAFFRSTPAVPELDFAGSIVVAGSAVPEGRGLIQGTRMFGSVSVSPHLGAGVGALGEYVVVEAESVARRPEGLAAEEAAGLPVAGCTALALVEKARLKRGDSVLVNGASGGIGTMVVQLVREAVGESGRVVAVCSGRNMELVKGLGANEVVDYQAHSPVHQHLAAKYSNPRFSAVVDAFGVEELYLHCADYLGPGKPFVTVGIAFAEYTYSSMLYSVLSMLKCEFCPRILGGVPREYVRVTGIANLKDMEKLADLVECGKLRIVVDSCWGMEDANEAYERMLSRRSRGKVIVKVQDG